MSSVDKLEHSIKELDLCGGEGRVETGPRADYLEWSEYFMAVSFLSSMRSKDPATQVQRWNDATDWKLHAHI